MARKRLIILRHAKSSWKSGAPDDHSRPLNKRGRRDAPRIGAYLRKGGWWPDVVISSDSQRTRLTWSGLADAPPDSDAVRWTRSLYHAGLDELVDEVVAHAGDAETVMVIGHNPGWEEAVEALSGEPHRFTTCNAALFETEAASWQAAFERDDFRLVDLIRPKELPTS